VGCYACHVALVRTDVSEECSATILMVSRIGGLETLAVASNRRILQRNTTSDDFPRSPILVTLMMEALLSSEKSVLTRDTCRNIQEGGILHSHCYENLKSYILASVFHSFLQSLHAEWFD
jgi:hypothetical protein